MEHQKGMVLELDMFAKEKKGIGANIYAVNGNLLVTASMNGSPRKDGRDESVDVSTTF